MKGSPWTAIERRVDRSALQRWRVHRGPRVVCSGPPARRFRRDPTTAGARRVDEANTRSQAAGGGKDRGKHPETGPGCWRQRRDLRPLADVVKPCCAARAACRHPRMRSTAWAMVLTTLLCHPALVTARSLWEADSTRWP